MYKGTSIHRVGRDFKSLDRDDRCKLYAMVVGYSAYWFPKDQREYSPVMVEHKFDMPMLMPKTGEAIKGVRLRGAMDLVALKLEDEKHYIVEHKTTSEKIGHGDIYWQTKVVDPQAAMYDYIGRELGLNIGGVIYNVLRVPQEKRKKKEGDKDYINRIVDNMIRTPEEYFARQLFTFTPSQIEEFEMDLYSTWKAMQHVRETGYAPRYTANCRRGFYTCGYLPICSGKSNISDERWVKREYHKLGESPTPDLGSDFAAIRSWVQGRQKK